MLPKPTIASIKSELCPILVDVNFKTCPTSTAHILINAPSEPATKIYRIRVVLIMNKHRYTSTEHVICMHSIYMQVVHPAMTRIVSSCEHSYVTATVGSELEFSF